MMLAAESNAGIGWGLVMIAILAGRYGWALGLPLLLGVGLARRTKSPAVGCFMAVALPAAWILIAISVLFHLRLLTEKLSAEPDPTKEVRSAERTESME